MPEQIGASMVECIMHLSPVKGIGSHSSLPLPLLAQLLLISFRFSSLLCIGSAIALWRVPTEPRVQLQSTSIGPEDQDQDIQD